MELTEQANQYRVHEALLSHQLFDMNPHKITVEYHIVHHFIKVMVDGHLSPILVIDSTDVLTTLSSLDVVYFQSSIRVCLFYLFYLFYLFHP